MGHRPAAAGQRPAGADPHRGRPRARSGPHPFAGQPRRVAV